MFDSISVTRHQSYAILRLPFNVSVLQYHLGSGHTRREEATETETDWMIGKFFELQVAQEILNAVRRCEGREQKTFDFLKSFLKKMDRYSDKFMFKI